MHFANSLLVTLAITSSLAMARPTPDLDVPPPDLPKIPISKTGAPDSDILRTVDKDISIFTATLMTSGGEIESLLKSTPDGLPAYIIPAVNSEVNANLKSIASAALKAGAGVSGNLEDAANTLTVPEAQLLKADAHLVVSLASHTAAVMKEIDAAGVSATNTELPSLEDAVVSAVKGIIEPFESYVAGTTALDGSGAETEVTTLKDTVAQAAASIDSMFG